ncbi:4-(cytidine 5'-diphospho)-2-C-methyl-D-erythritol kinase [uncultured Desulfovibrio sp.]|uniref:4-(cytidine 5'-diphospho)-2-C-methyl-D-erythritol kinase n=1 Tax=uncultured Desulfovibrio sp. TaxID=167968 RepID=UPI002616D3DC|nr:4-(cytidine 5'-diphospho)-2-C-methyl-D-erythritol kinase [uncultured Desulfovibrio sp.]
MSAHAPLPPTVENSASPLRLSAGCKVNLGLRITRIRPDGYHELDSLFLPLSAPSDLLELNVMPDAAPGITVICDAGILDPTDNTLTKAYKAYCQASTLPPPALRIRLHKGIPSGAGLGGGSSDAAALLRWLDTTSPAPLAPEALARVALRVGADVPFFLQGGACRVRGIGEILEPASVELPGTSLILVCPEERISTPWAYRAYDALAATKVRDADSGDLTNGAMQAKGTALSTMPDISTAATFCFRRRHAFAMRNDLEEAVAREYPVINTVRQSLTRYGAWAVVMSGSGSAVVGLIAAERAEQARAALTGDGWRTYVQTL